MTAKKGAPVVTSAELDATPPGSTPSAQLSTQRIHTGKIVKLDREHIRYPDGSEADVEIVRHSGAAAHQLARGVRDAAGAARRRVLHVAAALLSRGSSLRR